MTPLNYTYDPTKIAAYGKDRMRFELGDVMVDAGEETCALTDEEYEAILQAYPTKWRKAKLELLKSILMRFAYEVDTKVGPLSLSLRGRFDSWKMMHDDLAKEVSNMGVPSMNKSITDKPMYFYEGMHDDNTSGGKNGGHSR